MGVILQGIGLICIMIGQFVPFPDEKFSRAGMGDTRRVKVWVLGLALLIIGFYI